MFLYSGYQILNFISSPLDNHYFQGFNLQVYLSNRYLLKWFCKFLWLNLPEIIEENGAHPLLEIPYINVWPSQGKFKLLIQCKQVNTKAITPDGCSVFFTRKKQCNMYRVVSQSAPLTSLATDSCQSVGSIGKPSDRPPHKDSLIYLNNFKKAKVQ